MKTSATPSYKDLPLSVIQELIAHMSQFISESRFSQLQSVVENRTKYLTVVLEDIYQSQNASAVLRTCDCFGIQDVHIIENKNPFTLNPKVVMGSNKWLSIHRYQNHKNNTLATIGKLKSEGYRIVATSPHAQSSTLEAFDITKGKFALMFGTELTGLSETALENADEHLLIPTVGFSESLNLSVSAALCIYTLSNKLRNSKIAARLEPQEYNELLLHWLKLSIKSSGLIEKRFLKELNR